MRTVRERDEGFESAFLQRRVSGELGPGSSPCDDHPIRGGGLRPSNGTRLATSTTRKAIISRTIPKTAIAPRSGDCGPIYRSAAKRAIPGKPPVPRKSPRSTLPAFQKMRVTSGNSYPHGYRPVVAAFRSVAAALDYGLGRHLRRQSEGSGKAPALQMAQQFEPVLSGPAALKRTGPGDGTVQVTARPIFFLGTVSSSIV